MNYDDMEEEEMLAELFGSGVLIANSLWWRKDLPPEARDAVYVGVICNDVFAWGIADCEQLPYSEIKNLYMMYKKDAKWGPAMWCIRHRKQPPQKPVREAINADGVWSI